MLLKDVGKLEDPQNRLAIKQLIKEIGEPRNYGLTEEEKAEEERRAAEERLAKEAMEEAEREHREAVELAEKMARWEEWVRVCVRGSGGGTPSRFGSCTSHPAPREMSWKYPSVCLCLFWFWFWFVLSYGNFLKSVRGLLLGINNRNNST